MTLPTGFLLTCAKCEQVHDADYEGGVCLVCKKGFCGACSQWREETKRRECKDCESTEQ